MPVELQIGLALISTVTVVGGFVFAAYQFFAFVRQRRQETALTLIHSLGPELEQALIETFVKFENLGYLLYARARPPARAVTV